MKRLRFLLYSTCVLSISWLFFPLQAMELDSFNLILEEETSVDSATASQRKAEWIARPKVELSLGENTVVKGEFRFRWDALDRLEPGIGNQEEVGDASRFGTWGDQADYELREFYVQTETDDWLFTLGKQAIVWGQTDGLKVLDVVNPQSFREFILDDFEGSRIPLWTVNVETVISDWDLQLIWIPDKTYSDLPEDEADFSFTSPLFRPQTPPGVQVDLREVERPDHAVNDADYGFRLKAFLESWDVTLNYLYHYHDNPLFFRTISISEQGAVAIVTPEYRRTHLIGGTFVNTFGDLTFRGEVGYSTDRYFLTEDPQDADGLHPTGEWSYVLGFDWYGLSDTILSAQLFQSLVQDDDPGLVRDQNETDWTFKAERKFLNETVTVDVLWLANVNRSDGLIRPKVIYEWQDGLNLHFGGDVFYGDEDGFYGQFEYKDQWVLGAEWGVY